MNTEELELIQILNGYYRSVQLIGALEKAEAEHSRFLSACRARNVKVNEDENRDYSGMLRKAYADAMTYKTRVQALVELVDDAELKAILYSRYICLMNTYEIGDTVHCSRNSVFRYHKKAIRSLLEKIKEAEIQGADFKFLKELRSKAIGNERKKLDSD